MGGPRLEEGDVTTLTSLWDAPIDHYSLTSKSGLLSDS